MRCCEDSNHEIVRELVLIGEAAGWDGFEPRQESLVSLVALRDGVEGAVGQLVVVAVVAESSGALGKVAQIGFVLLVEKCVLGGDAVGHRFDCLGKD